MEDVAADVVAASRRDLYLALAARLSRILGACEFETLDVAVEECLQQLGEYAGVDVAFLILTDEQERVVEDWRWIHGERTLAAPEPNSPVRDTFGSVTEILRLGHTIAVDDLAQIELAPSERAIADANGLRAILMAPVRMGSTLLGITGLQVLDEPFHWEPALVEQIEFFAELMVKAVVRTRERGALAAAQARARRIAEYLPDGLLLVDSANKVTFVSPSLARAAGISSSDLEGGAVTEFVHPDDVVTMKTTMAASALTGSGLEVRMGTGSEWRWFALSWQLVHEPDSGVADETVITLRDVHDQHLEADSLTRERERDPLTGLLDRRSFDRILADMATRRATIVIAFIDVDHFKAVNDTYGHTVGDEVLRTIGDALASGARSGDVVARVGGDEFCVVASVDHGSKDAPGVVGRRLLHVVSTALAAIPHRVTVSIGIGGPGDAGSSAQLREAADSAMYVAKRSGGGRFEIATPPPPH